MALEIFATPVVDALIKNLGSAIWTELGSIWGVKDEIERLRRLLSTINAVLEDAEGRSINEIALRKCSASNRQMLNLQLSMLNIFCVFSFLLLLFKIL